MLNPLAPLVCHAPSSDVANFLLIRSHYSGNIIAFDYHLAQLEGVSMSNSESATISQVHGAGSKGRDGKK